jgi:hypothetical protein
MHVPVGGISPDAPAQPPAGTTAYYRMRLRVNDFGRTWTWRRAFFRRVGALVDLHFCDPRDAALVPHGTRYERLIVPIGRLNAFVIVLAALRMRKTSPELRYLRLLEGRKWERYLRRATDLRRREKFLVHYWRAEDVGVGNEFRAFLELGRNTESLGVPAMLSIAALTALFVAMVDSSVHISNSYIGRFLEWLGPALSGFLFSWGGGSITLVALAALFVLFWHSVKFTAPTRRFLQRIYRAIEDYAYRHRAELGGG